MGGIPNSSGKLIFDRDLGKYLDSYEEYVVRGTKKTKIEGRAA